MYKYYAKNAGEGKVHYIYSNGMHPVTSGDIEIGEGDDRKPPFIILDENYCFNYEIKNGSFTPVSNADRLIECKDNKKKYIKKILLSKLKFTNEDVIQYRDEKDTGGGTTTLTEVEYKAKLDIRKALRDDVIAMNSAIDKLGTSVKVEEFKIEFTQ